jgi:hypothetical protein
MIKRMNNALYDRTIRVNSQSSGTPRDSGRVLHYGMHKPADNPNTFAGYESPPHDEYPAYADIQRGNPRPDTVQWH